MAEVDAKTQALLDEGLTPGEARYLTSSGEDDSGLNLDEPARADEPASTSAAQEPAALQRDRSPQDDTGAARENELRELRERNARLDERLTIFRQAVEQPAESDKPKLKPDRETDPFGYMAWLEERVESFAPKLEQVTTQFQERDAAAALQNSYVADARSFSAAQSDFPSAYRWLMANRDAELAAAGYADPQERRRIITADERDIVARALQGKQQNPNAPGPAQIVYGLAKARGYQMPAAANGAAAQRGGAAVSQDAVLSKLVAMGDDEYLAWRRSLNPAQRKQYSELLGAAR
jgi:hypothetical protein